MVAKNESEENVSTNRGFYIERGIFKEEELVNLNPRSVFNGMTDDEILEAAAKISATRKVEAEEIARKQQLLREYANDNLRELGLVNYAFQEDQLVAFMRSEVDRDRFAIEICGFSDSGNVISLSKVVLDLKAALIIAESMNRALEI